MMIALIKYIVAVTLTTITAILNPSEKAPHKTAQLFVSMPNHEVGHQHVHRTNQAFKDGLVSITKTTNLYQGLISNTHKINRYGTHS